MAKGVDSFEVEGLGQVLVRRRKGLRALKLSVRNDGRVAVLVNSSTPLFLVKRFVIEHEEWIKLNLKKHLGEGLLKDGILIYDGQAFGVRAKFKIEARDGSEVSFKFNKADFTITILISSERIEDGAVRLSLVEKDYLEGQVIEALRVEAQQILPLRLNQLAKMNELYFGTVRVRNVKSRWGSCSYQNNISLSLWLMILPEALRDYVLVHELVHTVHKNHSKQFWQAVEEIVPDYAAKKRQLKKYAAQVWW
jgi:predicted metal-dependent hydrolase